MYVRAYEEGCVNNLFGAYYTLQADASLPNKCEEVEGEEFGGGRDFGGGAKISALSLNRGGTQEGVWCICSFVQMYLMYLYGYVERRRKGEAWRGSDVSVFHAEPPHYSGSEL